MAERIKKKTLECVISLFILSLLLFSVFYFLEGDSSSALLGEEISENSEALYKETIKEKGFIKSYFVAMKNFFSLNWGKTIGGESIKRIVFTSFPVTLSLVFYSSLISISFSLFTSLLTERRKGGGCDRFFSLLSSLFLLMPTVVTSLLLILLFSATLHIFPVAGYSRLSSGYIQHIKSLFLPSLSLSFVSSAFLMRMFKKGLDETMSKSFIVYARAKGVREKNIVLKTALRPTLPVIFSASGEAVISLFASSTVVETVFALPGFGRALVKAALERDVSLSFVLVMITALVVSFILFISSVLALSVGGKGDENE